MMKLFRLAATFATTIGLALVGVCYAAGASARFAPEPRDSGPQLVTPPAASTTSGTSTWWFVLVAAVAVAGTIAVMYGVRARRARRMISTAG
jgi:hypothetical protein